MGVRADEVHLYETPRSEELWFICCCGNLSVGDCCSEFKKRTLSAVVAEQFLREQVGVDPCSYGHVQIVAEDEEYYAVSAEELIKFVKNKLLAGECSNLRGSRL